MDGNTYSIVMLVVMLAIFYFLLIRPENKRKSRQRKCASRGSRC